MPDTILDLARAKVVLKLKDADSERDNVIQNMILPGVDDIVEQHVGWVVKRDRTFHIGARQRGQEVVLPGGRVITVKSAQTAAGETIDVTGVRVDEAGVVIAAPGGALPYCDWSITVETGMNSIPKALLMAASELLVTAWENYQAGDPKPFLVSYRAAAWLAPFTPGATFA